MLNFLKKFLPERCTECGKTFSRLEWGGRNHVTRNGGSYLHNIDYIVTLKCKTFEEKRNAISRLEETDRQMRKLHKELGGKFCRNHYKGCPQ